MGFITLSNLVALSTSIQVDQLSVTTLVVLGSHSVVGVSQFSAASFSGRVVQFLASTPLASLALASNQVSVSHATTGSVLTFTWKGSDGNMFRANISGASA